MLFYSRTLLAVLRKQWAHLQLSGTGTVAFSSKYVNLSTHSGKLPVFQYREKLQPSPYSRIKTVEK
ncbi:hypothetical protein A4R89_11460 [Acetobacter ascendens]|nr:hypothetical protein A4R89_11460 [Acetobacter ascendens]